MSLSAAGAVLRRESSRPAKSQPRLRCAPSGHGASILSTQTSNQILLVAGGRLVTDGPHNTLIHWASDGSKGFRRVNIGSGEAHSHVDRVTAVAAHGALLLSASLDGTVRVWDLDAPEKCVHVIESVEKRPVSAVALLGHMVYFGDDLCNVETYDLRTGEQDGFQLCAENNEHRISSLAITDAQTLWVAGDSSGVLYGWAVDTFECTGILTGHESTVTSLLDAGNGQLLSGSTDTTVRLWDSRTSSCLGLYQSHNSPVIAIAASLHFILSCDVDGEIRVHNRQQAELVFVSEDASAHAIAVHKGMLLAVGATRGVAAWKLSHFDALLSASRRKARWQTFARLLFAPCRGLGHIFSRLLFEGHSDAITAVVVWGDYLYTGSKDATIRRWRMDSSTCEQVMHQHEKAITSLAVHQTCLVSAGLDGKIVQWSWRGRVQATHDFHAGSPVNVLTVVGRTLFSGGDDCDVVANNLVVVDVTKRFVGHMTPVVHLAATKRFLYSASADGQIRVWNMRSTNCIMVHEPAMGVDRVLALTPTVVLCSQALRPSVVQRYKVVDASKKADRVLNTLKHHRSEVRSIAMSPDIIVSGAADSSVVIAERSTGHSLRKLGGQAGAVNRVLLAGEWIVTCGDDGRVILYDNRSYEQVADFSMPQLDSVTAIAVSPAGVRSSDHHLFCGGRSSNIVAWHVEGDHSVDTLEGHTDWIQDLVYVPADVVVVKDDVVGFLYSASIDGLVRMWHPTRLFCLRAFTGHKDTVTAVAALADRSLFSAGADGTIMCWNPRAQVEMPVAQLRGHAGAVLCLELEVCERQVSSIPPVRMPPLLDAYNAKTKTPARLDVSPTPNRRASVGAGGRRASTVAELGGAAAAAVAAAEAEASELPTYAGRLFSGSSDCTIRVWDVATNSMLFVLEGHTGSVRSLSFFRDAVVSGGADTEVHMWNLRHSLTLVDETLAVEGTRATCACVSEQWVFVGFDDRVVRRYGIHHLADPSRMRSYRGHERAVTAVAAPGLSNPMPNKALAILSGCDDGSAREFDLRNGSTLTVFKSAEQSPIWVVMSLIVLFSDFLQLMSLPFIINVPWDLSTPGITEVSFAARFVTAETKDLYILLFYIFGGLFSLFSIILAVHFSSRVMERIATRSRRSSAYRILQRIFWVIVWTSSTILFLPGFRVLITMLDCTYRPEGNYLDSDSQFNEDALECWTLPHLFYAVPTLLLLAIYLPLSLRMAIVAGNMDMVASTWVHWRRDNFIAENQHFCSIKTPVLDVIYFIMRVIVVAGSILFTTRIKILIPVFAGAMLVLIISTIVIRPYYDVRMNSLRLASYVCVALTCGVAYLVILADENGGDAEFISLLFLVLALPFCVLSYLVISFLSTCTRTICPRVDDDGDAVDEPDPAESSSAALSRVTSFGTLSSPSGGMAPTRRLTVSQRTPK